MNRILVIAEHDGQHLNAGTTRAVACATSIPDGEITVVVYATDGATVAAEAARLNPVGRILLYRNPAFAHPLAAVLAPHIAELAKWYTHVLAASTTFGKDVLPRAVALLGVTQISDVMAVESACRFRRPVYAGNAIATVEVMSQETVMATVRTASYSPAEANGAATIETVDVTVTVPQHMRFVRMEAGATDRPDLQSAARVVAGGRALGSADNFKHIYNLADKLGAAVGASRAAVDAGYVPNELQVGQTGKIIAPELYMAIGISGAIQHLTSIKDARTIVAINKDPEASIFEIADVGLVGDLFTILPELEQSLDIGNL